MNIMIMSLGWQISQKNTNNVCHQTYQTYQTHHERVLMFSRKELPVIYQFISWKKIWFIVWVGLWWDKIWKPAGAELLREVYIWLFLSVSCTAQYPSCTSFVKIQYVLSDDLWFHLATLQTWWRSSSCNIYIYCPALQHYTSHLTPQRVWRCC